MASLDAIVKEATVEIDGEGAEQHAGIHLCSVQASVLPAGDTWVTRHRYSDFHDLKSRMLALPRSERPDKAHLPRLTGRKMNKGTSQVVVDRRIIKLTTYLQSLCRLAQHYPTIQSILLDFMDEMPSDQPRARPSAASARRNPTAALMRISAHRSSSFCGGTEEDDRSDVGLGEEDDDHSVSVSSTVSAPTSRTGSAAGAATTTSDLTGDPDPAQCSRCGQVLQGVSAVQHEGRMYCGDSCWMFTKAEAAKGSSVLSPGSPGRGAVAGPGVPAASSQISSHDDGGSTKRSSLRMFTGLFRGIGMGGSSAKPAPPREMGPNVHKVHEGWLLKRGGQYGGRKSWKQRWFVLTDSALFYHSSKPSGSSSTLLGVKELLPVPGAPPATIRALPATAAEELGFSLSRLAAPFFMSIETPGRELFLCATNAEDQARWLRKLAQVTAALGGSRPPSQSSSGTSSPASSPVGRRSPRHSAVFAAMGSGRGRGGALHLQRADVITMADLNEQRARLPKRQSGGEGSATSAPPVPPTSPRGEALTPVAESHPPSPHEDQSPIAKATPAGEDSDEVFSQRSPSLHSLASAGDGDAPRRSKRNSLFSVAGAAQWEVHDEEVEMLSKLGKGQFGDVYQGRLWGTDVAVKLLVSAGLTEDILASLREEVAVLSSLRHPHIVLFIGCNTSCANPFIVTEFCSRGSLDRLVYAQDAALPATLALRFALQCAQGMAYIHSRDAGMIHRDVKCENLLLSGGWDVKVADFGLTVMKARVKGNASSGAGAGGGDGEVERDLANLGGTPQFCAPEVFEGEHPTNKVDVYAFGVVLCELFHRVLPFSDAWDRWDFIQCVLEDGATPTLPVWTDVPARYGASTATVPLGTPSPLLLHAAAEVRAASEAVSEAPRLPETVHEGSAFHCEESWGDDDVAFARALWQGMAGATPAQLASGTAAVSVMGNLPTLHPWRVVGPGLDGVPAEEGAADLRARARSASGSADASTPAIFLSPGTGRLSMAGGKSAALGSDTPLPPSRLDKLMPSLCGAPLDSVRPGRVQEWMAYEGDGTGVLRALIEACLHRDPDCRPHFHDIVTLLREVVALPTHDLFLCFELPRLQETLSYGPVAAQGRAAREISALCCTAMADRTVNLRCPPPELLLEGAGAQTPSFLRSPPQRRASLLGIASGRSADGSLPPVFGRVLAGSPSPDAPLALQVGTLTTALPHLMAAVAAMLRCHDMSLRAMCGFPLTARGAGGLDPTPPGAQPHPSQPTEPATPAADSKSAARGSKMAARRAARKAMEQMYAQRTDAEGIMEAVVAGVQALEFLLFTWVSLEGTDAAQQQGTVLPFSAMEHIASCGMLPPQELSRVAHSLATLASAPRPLLRWAEQVQQLLDTGAKAPRGAQGGGDLSTAKNYTVRSHVQGTAARLFGTLWVVLPAHRGKLERILANTLAAACLSQHEPGAHANAHLAWLCKPFMEVQAREAVRPSPARRATVAVPRRSAAAGTPGAAGEGSVIVLGNQVLTRGQRLVAGTVDTSSTAKVSDTVASWQQRSTPPMARRGSASGSSRTARPPSSVRATPPPKTTPAPPPRGAKVSAQGGEGEGVGSPPPPPPAPEVDGV
ncbi:drkD [Symbiodinium sp. KB8]|nr:drkD [Symbiodinium sp. KB8]